MKTVIIAGTDSKIFAAADYINPDIFRIIGYSTTDKKAWNVHYNRGELKWEEDIQPIMPMEEIARFAPDMIVIAVNKKNDDENLKSMLNKLYYKGEVVSLKDVFDIFSIKMAAIRKCSLHFNDLGIEGAIADIGCGRCDVARQINAANPERKLYLFDTFTGYDERDIAKEKEGHYSDCEVGDGALSEQELGKLDEFILHSMPYKEKVKIKKGWFPETLADMKNEKYVFVNVETGLYAPTYNAIKYYIPRLVRGGIIMISNYEDANKTGVSAAIRDIEKEWCPFLITPLCDLDGTIMITRP